MVFERDRAREREEKNPHRLSKNYFFIYRLVYLVLINKCANDCGAKR